MPWGAASSTISSQLGSGSVWRTADSVRASPQTGSAIDGNGEGLIISGNDDKASDNNVVENNLIGADETPGGSLILVFDVPSDLAPSVGPATYLPGQVARWDPGLGTFDLHDTLTGWPLNSEVDALACQGNPGRVPRLVMDKSTLTPGDVTLNWQSSCSQGAENHVVYEGFVGSYYSHTMKDCLDDFADNTEEVTPHVSSTYYIVVPATTRDEGSYGLSDTAGVLMERPQPVADIDRCVVAQTVTACP